MGLPRQRLVRPEDQPAVPAESRPHPGKQLALHRVVEVGEDQVPAQDDVEGPRGHLLPDVLVQELDPPPPVLGPEPKLLTAGLESALDQIGRDLAEAAAPVGRGPGAGEQALVDVRRHHP